MECRFLHSKEEFSEEMLEVLFRGPSGLHNGTWQPLLSVRVFPACPLGHWIIFGDAGQSDRWAVWKFSDK